MTMDEVALVSHRSSAASKIALFRSLFRGREDLYPRRFESLTSGRSGYAPACSNEWLAGVCEKPRIKCADCPNRRFLPITDQVVRWHLSGADDHGKPFTMGVYPMLLDESCHFLAVDFDGEQWRDDATAYLAVCARRGVPATLERSRSGNGGHIWLFFDEAVSAGLARRLGALLLTEAMDDRPDLGFRSYDRFFPSQDTLPRGGFGNLIALPLQHEPRKAGNSVFVDAESNPYADQWAHLSQLGRITSKQAESLVEQAEKNGRVLGIRTVIPHDDLFATAPWNAPPSRRPIEPAITTPIPDNLEIVLADRVYIPKEDLPPSIVTRLMRLAAFQNPEFYRAQAMRLPTYGKPRVVACADDGARFIELPRGCLEEVEALLRGLGIELSIQDQRYPGLRLTVSFQGVLRSEQETAAKAMLAHDTGVLAATTAFGKTVVAAWLIAQRGVNTLILVHRKQLLEQWVTRLGELLDVAECDIGRLGGGRKRLTGKIDVALIQSLTRKGLVDDRIADYGYVVVDECHHVPAFSFELAVSRAKAKYLTGLSATVVRKDGHQPIVFMQCGPVRHRVDAKRQAAKRPFSHVVLARPTCFRIQGEPEDDARIEFQRVCDQLTKDNGRNQAICSEIVQNVQDGRAPLVLTERVDHLQTLADGLRAKGLDIVNLQGGMGNRALTSALARAAESVPGRVLLATGRFIGEGFDNPRLDSLFLTMPVSWRGTIFQYVGRLHRLHDHKREVRVYDYADLDVPMLSRMFDRRCRAYEAAGYSISLPASAVPGWPASVQLPADGPWKHRYSASVRRLLRDGVDEPLAELFSTISGPIPFAQPDTLRAGFSQRGLPVPGGWKAIAR